MTWYWGANPEGQLPNSDLDLATLVLHKATIFVVVPAVRMSEPDSGLDNTPTISWSTREASTINLVVADLLRIHTLRSRKISLDSSIFYHPLQESFIMDDASSLFHLPETSFLTHMYSAYPQLLSLWQTPPRLSELISCMHARN